jgi:hypothetical protein
VERAAIVLSVSSTFVGANPFHRGLSLVPIGLAILGAVVPLVGGGFSAAGLALAWLGAIAVVTVARAAVRLEPPARVLVDIVGLALTLVMLAPEGGWWFVPAVVAQLLLDRRAALVIGRTLEGGR